MKTARKDIEIMAPVGSYESLMAAIQGGADAVYFGLDKLNMRARSSFNFTKEDLPEIMNICRENHINTYLTLNIVFYDQELQQMKELVDLAKEFNITAVIASDHSVINYARSVGVECTYFNAGEHQQYRIAPILCTVCRRGSFGPGA